MTSLFDDKQADIIDALNTISIYLDNIINKNNIILIIWKNQTLLSFNLLNPIPMIPQPRFWTYSYP